MATRCIITGRSGQVARAISERAARCSGLEIIHLSRPEFELAHPDLIERQLCAAAPDIIFSVAAYTAVDQAECDEETAFAVNAVAPGEIGRVAKMLGVPVIHLSTDYVFDGEKPDPYDETDITAPLNVYGRSKLEGEQRLMSSGADCVILRTAWVYSPFDKNFVATMLRLAAQQNEISVIMDQWGNPTSALDIADAMLAIAEQLCTSRRSELQGIFHMSAQGEASWDKFAEEIFHLSRAAGGPWAAVRPISTSEYPARARRPTNSRLDCSKLENIYSIRLPDWHMSIAAVVNRLIGHDSYPPETLEFSA